MGQPFFYCSGCGTRITGDELESGEAQRTSTRIRCGECAKKKTQRKRLDPVRTDGAAPPA